MQQVCQLLAFMTFYDSQTNQVTTSVHMKSLDRNCQKWNMQTNLRVKGGAFQASVSGCLRCLNIHIQVTACGLGCTAHTLDCTDNPENVAGAVEQALARLGVVVYWMWQSYVSSYCKTPQNSAVMLPTCLKSLSISYDRLDVSGWWQTLAKPTLP